MGGANRAHRRALLLFRHGNPPVCCGGARESPSGGWLGLVEPELLVKGLSRDSQYRRRLRLVPLCLLEHTQDVLLFDLGERLQAEDELPPPQLPDVRRKVRWGDLLPIPED